MTDKKTKTRKRKTPEQQLAELETKEQQLQARIQKKRSDGRTQKRKQDSRRKIIAGALALEHMEHDGHFREVLGKLIDTTVTRPEDRKLFGL